MKYNDVIDRLQNLTLTKINTTEIADILNVPVRTLYTRSYRNSEVSTGELKKLEEFYNVNLFNITTQANQDSVTIDYYPDVLVSCGNGIFSLGETKEKMTVPKHFIKGYSDAQKYIIVTAFSDSMQPKIEEKDLLIVRLTNFEEIIDNHIYVFCHEGRFYCKYLSYNVGQIIVKSENPDYPTRYIEKDNLCNFELIGEIVGLMRDFR